MSSRTLLSSIGCLALSCAVSASSGLVRASGAQADGTRLLTAARAAVGTEAALRRARSLVLTGAQQAYDLRTGQATRRASVELRILLPDNYLVIEVDSGKKRETGFSGNVLLHRVAPAGDSTLRGTSVLRMQAVRHELARWVLGALAEPRTASALTIRPGGDADTLEAIGGDGFAAWLDLDKGSHVPLRVRYVRPGSGVGGTVGSGVASGVTSSASAAPPPAGDEVTLGFEDRKLVDGLNLPHRITQSRGGRLVQELRFRTIVVNPPLELKDFRYAAGPERVVF
jgi:hypothetical protein